MSITNDKKRLHDIIKARKEYQRVDVRTADLINTYTAANISTAEAEGGKVDMCTAIQEMIEEGRTEGRVQGRQDGRTERDTEIKDLIQTMRASGASPEQILRQIEQSTSKKPRTRTKRK